LLPHFPLLLSLTLLKSIPIHAICLTLGQLLTPVPEPPGMLMLILVASFATSRRLTTMINGPRGKRRRRR